MVSAVPEEEKAQAKSTPWSKKDLQPSFSFCLQLQTAFSEYLNAVKPEQEASLDFALEEDAFDPNEEYPLTNFFCGGSLDGKQLFVMGQASGTFATVSGLGLPIGSLRTTQ